MTQYYFEFIREIFSLKGYMYKVCYLMTQYYFRVYKRNIQFKRQKSIESLHKFL